MSALSTCYPKQKPMVRRLSNKTFRTAGLELTGALSFGLGSGTDPLGHVSCSFCRCIKPNRRKRTREKLRTVRLRPEGSSASFTAEDAKQALSAPSFPDDKNMGHLTGLEAIEPQGFYEADTGALTLPNVQFSLLESLRHSSSKQATTPLSSINTQIFL